MVLAYYYHSRLQTRIPKLKADQEERERPEELPFLQRFTEICQEHGTAIIETINFGIELEFFTDVIKPEEHGNTIKSSMNNLFWTKRRQN